MDTYTPEALTGADKDWQAHLERLRNRKPLERTVTLRDEEALAAVQEAEVAAGHVIAKVRQKVNEKHAKVADEAEREKLVKRDIDKNVEVRRARDQVANLQTIADDNQVRIPFRGVGADVYEALQSEHPPTQEQRKAGNTYNVHRFAPVLIAASSINPMSVVDAAQLVGGEVVGADGKVTRYPASLTIGEAGLLFQTAVIVNEGTRGDLGKG